jgi:hypothetical protein
MKAATEYKLDTKSNWWIHCLTSNYLSRWYRHTIDDIVTFQKEVEAKLFSTQKEVETSALLIYNGQSVIPNIGSVNSNLEEPSLGTLNPTSIPILLQKYQETASNDVVNAWWQFFFEMAGKYRDVYNIEDIHVENFNRAYEYLSVPRWWFEQIGFWGAPGTAAPGEKEATPIYPLNVPSEDSQKNYEQKYPKGYYQPYPERSSDKIGNGAKSGSNMLIVICSGTIGAFLGALITYLIINQKQNLYLPIRG